MGEGKSEVLQGTLDLMVLKTLYAMGPLHGFGIARRIEQVSDGVLDLNEGTVYTALLRSQQQRVYKREHRGVQTNPQSQRQYHRRARYGPLGQHPHAEAYIPPPLRRGKDPSLRPLPLFERRHVSELSPRCPRRLPRAHALQPVAIFQQRNVLADFLFESFIFPPLCRLSPDSRPEHPQCSHHLTPVFLVSTPAPLRQRRAPSSQSRAPAAWSLV